MPCVRIYIFLTSEPILRRSAEGWWGGIAEEGYDSIRGDETDRDRWGGVLKEVTPSTSGGTMAGDEQIAVSG